MTFIEKQDVVQRIRGIESALLGQVTADRDGRLSELWQSRWEPTLQTIIQERLTPPKAEISLVGGTGAGKSTLVNAILQARILPVSNMKACTAAISEISYSPEDTYRARVEFVSRESWYGEFELLLEDLRDSKSTAADGENVEDGVAIAIPRVARDKLAAVYGPFESNEPPSLRLSDYQEPTEVSNALDRGYIEVSTADLEGFRKQVRNYLDSSCRFWPLVKTVKISGPFSALECGARLIDLPGINDPNEAREQITREYLKRCQFVWVVFNIRRVLTKDVSNLMQSDDFVRQIVMDGRENALTFVGTASDDIDVDSAWEEFGLDEDASIGELAIARNQAVRREVTMQVGDIAQRLAHNAESPERAQGVKSAFLQSRIFTVSARDYLALSNLAKNQPKLGDIAATEIDDVRQHMVETCQRFGPEAQARSHHARIDGVLNEIKAEATRNGSAIDQKRLMSQSTRKDLGGVIDRLGAFLRQTLEDYQERFGQELSSGQEVLSERIKRATERGQHELGHVISQWRRMHWCTLRAVARRGGRFNSPTTGEHDFAGDVAKPILDGITFAWTDFFGSRLTNVLDRWSTKLVTVAQRHGLDLLKEVARLKLDDRSTIQADFEAVVQTTEKVIHEQVGQIQTEMNQRIDEVRRTLYEAIPDQVRADMAPAFDAAAQEQGKGQKQRMLDQIGKHAQRVSRDMFHDMEEKIGHGVRSLNDLLGGKYREMRATVERHATVPAENLLGAGDISEEELDARRRAFSLVASTAEELLAGAGVGLRTAAGRNAN